MEENQSHVTTENFSESTSVTTLSAENTLSPSKKKNLVRILLVGGLLLTLVVGYLVSQGILPINSQRGNVTPTPVPTLAVLNLVKPVAPLTASIGTPFTFQIRVTEMVQNPLYEIIGISGATVSQSGLVSWTPTEEGKVTGKVKVTTAMAQGEIEIQILVNKESGAVSGKNMIDPKVQIPLYPVFYSLEMDDNVRQLWVMNKDGSGQVFTGVSHIAGEIENVPYYGGVLYTVSSTEEKTKGDSLKLFYYSSLTGDTLVVENAPAPKGYVGSVVSPTLSPSGEYIVYIYSTYKIGEMGDEVAYYVYNLATGEKKKLPEAPAISMQWSKKYSNSVHLARESGWYAYHVWTEEKTLLSADIGSIPSEGDYLEIDENTTIELQGNPDQEVKLVLKKSGESKVVDTSTWAVLQPFYCVSPDKKSVMYEYDIRTGDNTFSTIKRVSIEDGTVSWVTTNTPIKEGYWLKGCLWTSDHTVIIHMLTDETKPDSTFQLVELDTDTNDIRPLTTKGTARLIYY